MSVRMAGDGVVCAWRGGGGHPLSASPRGVVVPMACCVQAVCGTARHGAVPAVEGAHPPPPNKKTKPSEAAAQTVEKGCGGAAPPAGAEAEEEDEDQEKEKEKEKASEASSAGCPR